MSVHENARLTPKGREVLDAGLNANRSTVGDLVIAASTSWSNGRGRRRQVVPECLNETPFRPLAEARETLDAWQEDYTPHAPRSAPENLTPKEFAKKQASTNTQHRAINSNPRTPHEMGKLGIRLPMNVAAGYARVFP